MIKCHIVTQVLITAAVDQSSFTMKIRMLLKHTFFSTIRKWIKETMLNEAIVIGAHIHNENSPADVHVMVFSEVVPRVLRADLILGLTHIILTDMINTH